MAKLKMDSNFQKPKLNVFIFATNKIYTKIQIYTLKGKTFLL